jgi:hypothetical protein
LLLGLAALEESGEDSAVGVVPERELGCGCGEVSVVDEAEERGAGERGDAQVKCEVDEGVELVLVDGRGDELVDGCDGSG